jgi:beta-phosphoglucomutase family hydrolase
MSAEDLEKYEAEMELQLYREYRDVVGLFTHVVETERRFYLTNDVEMNVRSTENGEVFFEVVMHDAWVWDMYRPARFVKNVRVVTFKDVNIEELAKSDLELPEDKPGFSQLSPGGAPPRAMPGRKPRAPGTWPGRAACVLGLPDGVSACLFDMDGVITRTATVHDAAWKEMFDEFLRAYAARAGGQFVPFDPVTDYGEYVDGKPRLEGTRSFLASRSIELPEGSQDDPPGTWTIWGLSNRKNDLVLTVLARDGVEVYEGSQRYLVAARAAGLQTAIVSSSANTVQVLEAGGIAGLFDVRVDAQVAQARGLHGKPAPDTFLAAAQMLGATPAAAVVFEDALAGVEAGRAGSFGYVVGVDRVGHAAQLRTHGADVVVADLADLL